ncbi:MAG: DUF4974 domain-containing protein [Telmatospirillum sp.]|nr:DUF4974 domain-containing protein [Telmatospirillum sp.]
MSFEENDDRALREASEWMSRITGGSLSWRDRKALKQWLDADTAHVKAINAVEAEWRKSGRLAAAQAARKPRRDLMALLFEFRGTTRLRVAAAAAISVALAVIVFLHPFRETEIIETAVGETRLVTLPDGSRIRLNTDSRVAVTTDLSDRFATLEKGEAEFTVSHRFWSPFHVDTGTVRIRVTGTHFLVRTEEGRTETYLVNGGIELRDPVSRASLAKLEPGSRAIVGAGGKVDIEKSDGIRETAWINGNLMFDRTPLGDALTEFQRYAPVTVSVKPAELRALKVSGVYHSNDLFGFLETLASLNPVRIIKTSHDKVLVEGLPAPDGHIP